MSINNDFSTTISPKYRFSTTTFISAFEQLNKPEVNKVSFNLSSKPKHAKFSDEITIVFVPSFKKYNKLEPIYKRNIHTEQKQTKCECLIY
jgi:hypothetical protein